MSAREFWCHEMTVTAQQFWPTSDSWPDGVTLEHRFGGQYIKAGDWAVTLPNGQKVVCPDEFFREVFFRGAA